MFIDTYYDSPDNREHVQDYEDSWACEQGVPFQTDPFSAEETTLNQAILQPREYWLKVLSVRIRHILSEWYEVVTEVKQRIEHYVGIFSPTDLSVYVPLFLPLSSSYALLITSTI